VREKQAFAMGGHPNGIVVFGASPDEAFRVLMRESAQTG
jgi:hypothetical protein